MELFETMPRIEGRAVGLSGKSHRRRLVALVPEKSIKRAGEQAGRGEVVAKLWTMCCPKGLNQ
ncbi:hypothetical protein ACFLTY_01980 [Chloroflexota bacterium]